MKVSLIVYNYICHVWADWPMSFWGMWFIFFFFFSLIQARVILEEETSPEKNVPIRWPAGMIVGCFLE